MRYLNRFLVLFAAIGLIFLWTHSLEGAWEWLLRLAAVAGGAALATAWAVRPWREMKQSAQRIQNGDFAARLDDVTPGDLREPSMAFNAMAERLAEFRKLSEEREARFRAVLAAGGRAIFLMDREGNILLVSPATRDFFPRFRDDAMAASTGLPGLSQLVEETLLSREAQTATLQESEAGRARVFNARCVPLEDGGAVVILDEITSQARLDRVKADLVANVSHELRTPLGAMSSLLEALESPDLTMEQRAGFEERLRKQQARMEALVGDLLSLSRLEGRHADVQEEPISLEASVREIFSLLEPAASEGGVSLKSEVTSGFVVHADRELLDTALKNLVDNGIRYNREGGEVCVRVHEESGETVIEVEDTGEGIPAAHLDRIFERFYRVDPHRSREKGGTGLGLAIVKHAASQLGGRVTVESQPGRGSTFRIHLPRRPQGQPATKQ